MSTKQKIFGAYFVIGLLFALYGWLFGTMSYKGFAYNLGRGVVWPLFIFPELGAVIGALILVIVVVLISIFVRTPR
jgi:hypothetical protein